jgi:hypothetical protein
MLGLYRIVIPSSRTTSDFSLAVLLIVNTSGSKDFGK